MILKPCFSLILICFLLLSCKNQPRNLTPEQLNQWCTNLSYYELITGLGRLEKVDTIHKYSYGALQERDIIGKYRECLFIINKKAQTNSSKEERYLLELISKDSTFLSYKIYNTIYRHSDKGLPWQTNELLYYGKNHEENERLKNIYQSTFKTPLNFNELFKTDLFFGTSCGITGMGSSEYHEIRHSIKNKDITTIEQWLQSSYTEKQLYGLMAYYKLSGTGIFSHPIKNIVAVIENKTGSCNRCSGCNHTFGYDLQEVIKQIKEGFYR